ncbi:MAG TPA: hypothetical protein VFK47_11595 [Ktedonobacteraceae bacterium]|nr:hypothetical protein [Ktedonobacteraceae bacterium]
MALSQVEILQAYQPIQRGPVMGPSARLSVGSGQTGVAAQPGFQSELPGYVSEQITVGGNLAGYQPGTQENYTLHIPLEIPYADNGRDLVGTYQPHDTVVAHRFFNQNRSAANWQEQQFPLNFRDLLMYQLVLKYQIQSFINESAPLDPQDYFLGYVTTTPIASEIGGSGYGRF